MGHRRQKLAVSDPVAGQLVGDNHPRHIPQALEQFTEKPLGCFGVSPRLHQDVEHVAVLVDRALQLMGDAVDLDENLGVNETTGIQTKDAALIELEPGVGMPPRNFSRWMSPVGVRRLSCRSPGWGLGLVG